MVQSNPSSNTPSQSLQRNQSSPRRQSISVPAALSSTPQPTHSESRLLLEACSTSCHLRLFTLLGAELGVFRKFTGSCEYSRMGLLG